MSRRPCRFAEIRDRIHARDEGERGREHFVSGTDAGELKREMERRSAGTERDRVVGADSLGELALEGVDVRPERRYPVCGKRIGDILLLEPGKMGRREEHPRGAHISGSRHESPHDCEIFVLGDMNVGSWGERAWGRGLPQPPCDERSREISPRHVREQHPPTKPGVQVDHHWR